MRLEEQAEVLLLEVRADVREVEAGGADIGHRATVGGAHQRPSQASQIDRVRGAVGHVGVHQAIAVLQPDGLLRREVGVPNRGDIAKAVTDVHGHVVARIQRIEHGGFFGLLDKLSDPLLGVGVHDAQGLRRVARNRNRRDGNVRRCLSVQ